MSLIQAPPSTHLLAKQEALEKAFDELALLEIDLESRKPLKAVYGRIIGVLNEYPLGLFINTKASCKPMIYQADSLVLRALAMLHHFHWNSAFCRINADGYTELYEDLQEALSCVLGVVEVENARPRLYPRKGDAQPQKKEATAKKNRRKLLGRLEPKK